MRVLGIDPGTRHCGWGIIDARSGSRMVHVAHGVLSPKASAPLAAKLAFIHAGLAEAIREHAPATVGVEEVFFAVNVKSALVLGHARGIALLAAAQAGLDVAAYAPTLIKQAVVGTGRAEKFQVSRMVSIILGLGEIKEVDASDALAIAITHATRGPCAPLASGIR